MTIEAEVLIKLMELGHRYLDIQEKTAMSSLEMLGRIVGIMEKFADAVIEDMHESAEMRK